MLRVPYQVSRLPGEMTVNGDLSDWPLDVPLVRLSTACTGCQAINADQPGGNFGVSVLFPDETPPASDLEAYFRIGWTPGALFVLALAKDDQFLQVNPADLPGTKAADPAETRDGVEIFLDTDGSFDDGYDTNDNRLFIGAGAERELYPRPQGHFEPSDSELQIAGRGIGACYFVEMKFSSTYLSGSPRGGRPPGAGTIYGFDIAINDWDVENGTPHRAHQVLWKHPGTNYYNETSQFPAIELQP